MASAVQLCGHDFGSRGYRQVAELRKGIFCIFLLGICKSWCLGLSAFVPRCGWHKLTNKVPKFQVYNVSGCVSDIRSGHKLDIVFFLVLAGYRFGVAVCRCVGGECPLGELKRKVKFPNLQLQLYICTYYIFSEKG